MQVLKGAIGKDTSFNAKPALTKKFTLSKKY